MAAEAVPTHRVRGDCERRVGKRLAARLEWIRETPGAETYGWDAHHREVARCREEGVPPPAPNVAAWIEDGWTPGEPLHEALVEHEQLRRILGDAAMDGPSALVLDWPAGWCGRSLAVHRAIVVRHLDELERIESEERGGDPFAFLAALRGGR